MRDNASRPSRLPPVQFTAEFSHYVFEKPNGTTEKKLRALGWDAFLVGHPILEKNEINLQSFDLKETKPRNSLLWLNELLEGPTVKRRTWKNIEKSPNGPAFLQRKTNKKTP